MKPASHAFRAFAFVLVLVAAAAANAQGSAPPSTVSFVVGDTTLNSGDQTILNTLVGHGHTVVLHDDNGISVAATAGSDAIVISSTASSSQIQATFKQDLRPVIVWESGLYDDFGMTGLQENVDFGFEFGVAEIELVAANSPIGDGLALGPITVTGGLEDTAWGVPGGSAVVVATVLGNPDRAAIFIYGQGAELADGNPAAGKRAGFFGDDDSASVWAADGLLLFEQVVEWALVDTPAPPAIIEPPFSETVVEGATAVFSAVAVGYPAPTYQWQKDGVDLPGETASTLSLVAAPADVGDYRLVVSNTEGTVSSDPVPLTLVDPWAFAFVVGNPVLSASDQRVYDKLIALGHSVTIHDDGGITLVATAASDAVIISSSVTGGNVGATFITDTRPILLWEAAIYGDMGLTGDVEGVDFGAVVPAQTQIDFVDVSTRVANGFALGRAAVTSSNQNMSWGVPGAEARVIATLVGNPNRAPVFSYDQGAILADGGIAAGIRVALFQTNNSAAAWTALGEQLFEQAVGALFLPPLAAPTILTQPQSATVLEGEMATFTVAADGVPAPTYRWRYEGIDLPGETSATLSFQAALADAGDYDVVVTNVLGSVTSDVATLTVTSANDPPAFTSTPVLSVDEGSSYGYSITVDDPNAGDTLTISAPTLPAWLTLTDNGNGTALLGGTPAEANIGDHPVVLEVSDAAGATDTQSFTVTVVDVEFGPTFTSRPVTAVTEGQAYHYAIIAIDPDGDPVDLRAGTLPSWITFTNNGDGTGELLGFPMAAQIGMHAVELFAEGEAGVTAASQTFTIVVNAAVDGPVITIIGNPQIVIRQSESYIDPGATAMDPQDGDLTSAIVVDNPVNTQVLGAYTVTYSVVDSAGNGSQAQRTVVVQRQLDGGGGSAGPGDLLALLLLAAAAALGRAPIRGRGGARRARTGLGPQNGAVTI